MDHGKSFSFFIMQKRVRSKNGTHISLSVVAVCVVAWQRKNGGWAVEGEKGGYYVPFVSGLALCCFLVCHARPGKRRGGQQMCLLGRHRVKSISEYWFLVLILHKKRN